MPLNERNSQFDLWTKVVLYLLLPRTLVRLPT
jgi:hypothetical protein